MPYLIFNGRLSDCLGLSRLARRDVTETLRHAPNERVIFYFLFNEPSKFEIHPGIRICRAIAFDDSLASLCEDRRLSLIYERASPRSASFGINGGVYARENAVLVNPRFYGRALYLPA